MTDRVAIAAIRRLRDGFTENDQDLVAVEAPLELTVRAGTQSRSLGVLMRTPGDDEDLVCGVLYTEQLIRVRGDIVSIAIQSSPDSGDHIDVTLTEATPIETLAVGRAVAGTSACGLCGKLAIDRVDTLGRVTGSNDVQWPISLLADLPARLRAGQSVFAQTGGLHAAGLVDAEGRLIAIREDVGRHNAVDKLVGAALAAGAVPAGRSLIVVSGRVAYEIVQKAVRAGAAGIVAVGAPSSLAVEAARATNLTLVGFARDGGFNIYAGEARVAVHLSRSAPGSIP